MHRRIQSTNHNVTLELIYHNTCSVLFEHMDCKSDVKSDDVESVYESAHRFSHGFIFSSVM